MTKTRSSMLILALAAASISLMASTATANTASKPSLPLAQRCAMGDMPLTQARNTVLVTLVTYINDQPVNLRMGINIRAYRGQNAAGTNWWAHNGCWTAIPTMPGKTPNLCGIIRVPGFKAGADGPCPKPTVDPSDPAQRLEYYFTIFYK